MSDIVCAPASLLLLRPFLQLIQRAANAQHSQSLKAALLQHVQHDLAAAGPHVGLQELDAAIQLLQVSSIVAAGNHQGVASPPFGRLGQLPAQKRLAVCCKTVSKSWRVVKCMWQHGDTASVECGISIWGGAVVWEWTMWIIHGAYGEEPLTGSGRFGSFTVHTLSRLPLQSWGWDPVQVAICSCPRPCVLCRPTQPVCCCCFMLCSACLCPHCRRSGSRWRHMRAATSCSC